MVTAVREPRPGRNSAALRNWQPQKACALPLPLVSPRNAERSAGAAGLHAGAALVPGAVLGSIKLPAIGNAMSAALFRQQPSWDPTGGR